MKKMAHENNRKRTVYFVSDIYPTVDQPYLGQYIIDQANSFVESRNGKITFLFIKPFFGKKFDFSFVQKQLRKEIRLHIIRVIPAPNYRFIWLKKISFLLSLTILRLIRHVPIRDSVFHSHSLSCNYLLSINLLKSNKRVVTIHGEEAENIISRPRLKKRFTKTLNEVNKVVIVGEPLKKYLSFFEVQNSKTIIIPNGIHDRSNMPIPEIGNKINILCVARLSPEKNIISLIQAINVLVKKKLNNFILTIVGEGPLKLKIENEILKFKLSKKIKILAPMSPNKILGMYQKSNIFCLPSYKEAFGLVHAEAMSFGLITIGSKGTGPEMFIQNNKNGYLVNSKSVEEISEVLGYVINNIKEVSHIAKSAKRTIHEKFSWAESSSLLEKTYENL